jgi:hypothetical protein
MKGSARLTPIERRKLVEEAVANTEERRPEHLTRQLEESLEGRTDRPPVIVLPRGSSSPIVLEKRPFYDASDGKWRAGLFDPQGHPADMPLRASETAWGR